MNRYINPVDILQSNQWRKDLKISVKGLNITSPIIISSKGAINRLSLNSIFSSERFFSNFSNNPNFEDCDKLIKFCSNKDFDGVIAIGGGSAMDISKVAMSFLSLKKSKIIELINYKERYSKIIPSIFVPSTHGTASEVTKWATIWDTKNKKKYSLSHLDLYPSKAILDGKLTLTLPMNISISTTLDALSHSFEAIWNKNANQKSTKLATKAIVMIMQEVQNLKKTPHDLNVRSKLLNASTTAGLAFSNTATAAAHSISYPLTLRYHIPHGIAASITLTTLLEINKAKISASVSKICNQLECSYKDLIKSIDNIPKRVVPFKLREWGVSKEDLNVLKTESFTKGRMDNNIVNLDEEDVLKILQNIY